ncbi:MAG: glycosyltransferase family 39 protein [Burkholderiaceae bacterium]|nr:glycosyltransferase family 39 protein [Burkholderiaceae bacterium]
MTKDLPHIRWALSSSGNLASILAGLFLLISLLPVVQLLSREWITFANEYTHVDEIFFAVCAARGLVSGDVPIAGCHDNKAPLIYALYQLLELGGSRYSLGGIKLAGAVSMITAVALVAFVAQRIGGKRAAVIGAALALQTFAVNAELLAFKTEVVGTIFMLAGAGYLLRWIHSSNLTALFGGGALFGMAVMTKQTFAFGAFAACLWLLGEPVRPPGRACADRLLRCLVFAAGVALPSAGFLALFWLRGEALDFLASVFLHAIAYGTGGAPLSSSERAWKVGWFLHQFGLVYPLTILFSVALTQWLQPLLARQGRPDRRRPDIGLLLALAIAMAVVPIVSRQYFLSHLLPAWLLMVVPAAVSVSAWLERPSADAGPTVESLRVVGAVGLLIAVLLAVDSWYLNGDVKKRLAGRQHVLDEASRVPGGRGCYGYVLGIRPEFYFFNGILPSSDVLYPAALAGAGAAPRPVDLQQHGPPLARFHSVVQVHAAKRLLAQFALTPPQYVLLVDRWARAPQSDAVSDVAVVRDHVAAHCKLMRKIDGKEYQAGLLFECGGSPAGRGVRDPLPSAGP